VQDYYRARFSENIPAGQPRNHKPKDNAPKERKTGNGNKPQVPSDVLVCFFREPGKSATLMAKSPMLLVNIMAFKYNSGFATIKYIENKEPGWGHPELPKGASERNILDCAELGFVPPRLNSTLDIIDTVWNEPLPGLENCYTQY
jgi:hypothetical protein